MRLQKTFMFVLLLLISINIFGKEALIFAIDIVRHGDRTPTSSFKIPKSPHKWKEGRGQLTALGMQQAYQVGVSLRKKYVNKHHLLPDHYHGDTIRVFSTKSDRTLMTAQSLLLGLYPLGTGPALPNGKPALPKAFQPIPIHTRTDPTDSEAKRKKFSQLLKQLYAKPFWEEKKAKLKNNFERWSSATGIDNKKFDLSLAARLGDKLQIRKIHNVSIPPELNKKDIEEMAELWRWVLKAITENKDISDLMLKDMLLYIKNYLQDAKDQKTPLKYVLFSDHCETIMGIMAMLQKPLEKVPPYVASLNFSLYKKNDKDYFVGVSYNNKPIVLPGCGDKVCALKEFIRLIAI